MTGEQEYRLQNLRKTRDTDQEVFITICELIQEGAITDWVEATNMFRAEIGCSLRYASDMGYVGRFKQLCAGYL